MTIVRIPFRAELRLLTWTEVFECKLTSLHKQAWYDTNDIAGRLRIKLVTTKTAQNVDRFSKFRFDGLGMAGLWKQ